MFKKLLVLITVLGYLSFNSFSTEAAGIPASASSKVCNATTKVCVSNVTNPETVKDEELLQACKDCCSLSQAHVPGSIKNNIKGCIPRCQKSCEKAYKKVTSKKK